jgi:hypothetical protein
LVASEPKATNPPSAETAWSELSLFPCTPPGPTLGRRFTPALRSWRNTSKWPFVSPTTMSGDGEVKATNRPSAEMSGR